VGVLWSLGHFSDSATAEAQVTAALRGVARPKTLGDFLAGLFAVAREEVVHAEALLAAIDATLRELGGDDFLIGLPALRLAFTYFPPAEREQIARRVLTLHGADPSTARSLLKLDVTDTATVLTLRKRWSFGEGEEPPNGPALGSRRIASAATLGALAKGQMVTRAARRRADRSVLLGDSRGGLTSVTPQAGDFQILPPPIRVAGLADLETTFRERGPRFLRPRLLAEDVHVLEVAAVESVAFLAGAQRLVATVMDVDGSPLRLVRPYRAVATHCDSYESATS
jgi:hypothetical protein